MWLAATWLFIGFTIGAGFAGVVMLCARELE